MQYKQALGLNELGKKVIINSEQKDLLKYLFNHLKDTVVPIKLAGKDSSRREIFHEKVPK